MERYRTIKTCSWNWSETNPLECAELRWRGKVTPRFFKCCRTFIYFLKPGTNHPEVLWLKRKNHPINKKWSFIFYPPIWFITHFLPAVYLLCASVHHLLSLELLYERPLERNWPSSLPVSAGYSLIKPAPFPLRPGWPAITMEADWRAVKYLLMLHLALGNCAQTCSRTVKHIFTPATHKQWQLKVNHNSFTYTYNENIFLEIMVIIHNQLSILYINSVALMWPVLCFSSFLSWEKDKSLLGTASVQFQFSNHKLCTADLSSLISQHI